MADETCGQIIYPSLETNKDKPWWRQMRTNTEGGRKQIRTNMWPHMEESNICDAPCTNRFFVVLCRLPPQRHGGVCHQCCWRCLCAAHDRTKRLVLFETNGDSCASPPADAIVIPCALCQRARAFLLQPARPGRSPQQSRAQVFFNQIEFNTGSSST